MAGILDNTTFDTAGSAETFGYDAVEDVKRRKAPISTLRSEDKTLTPAKRRKLVASTRDLQRNFSIAAWMIRKHLDFVSTFSFQSNTGIPKLDARIEELVKWASRKAQCDIAARHNLQRMIRLAEARRTVDGDVGLLKLGIKDRGYLQAIEGDRIRTPLGAEKPKDWSHGVKLNRYGRALAYGIHKRSTFNGFEFERSIPAHRMFLHGYYERFDQVRGISPLASALNPLRDTYENFEYALAKAKVAQLFGLVVNNDDPEPMGVVSETDDSTEGAEKYAVDFGKGPFRLDFGPDGDAKFLENKTPSAEFREFMTAIILASLKALDVPYSFYDESFTNFYGSRGGLIQYLQSCKAKRRDNAELLDAWTVWRLGIFVEHGYLELPDDMAVRDLAWNWVPGGVPWWDAAKEAKGHLMLLGASLTTPQRICRETDSDFYENVDQIAEAQEYAAERGVSLSFALPAVEPVDPEEEEAERERNSKPGE